MKILTARQMNAVDRLTTERYGLPSLILMENAGFQLLRALERRFPYLIEQTVVILCGKGNNGGDGCVLARHLLQRGLRPKVYLLAKPETVSGDARLNLDAWINMGGPLQTITGEDECELLESELRHADVVVDALLGTGISKPLQGLYKRAVEAVNRSGAFILAVDIPSGMFSDGLTGEGPTVRADLTVTFTAPKIAHLLNSDQEALGELRIAPIGTPPELVEESESRLRLMSREMVGRLRLPRPIDSHKGTYGHVLVAAGSLGKSGAAGLCARAALRAGAGLVTACLPRSILPLVASPQPEIMTEPASEAEAGHFMAEDAERVRSLLRERDVLALGPGLGRSDETVRFVGTLLRDPPGPVVVDADGLYALAGSDLPPAPDEAPPLVLTPHPGEFSRLLGRPVPEIRREAPETARRFALERRVWLVLKGFRTLVATPSGEVYVCPLGNPGMATAGMGDVLTGVLAAFLGESTARNRRDRESTTAAVVSGVFLHSLAGDLAAAAVGVESLVAGDVIDSLGKAFRRLDNP